MTNEYKRALDIIRERAKDKYDEVLNNPEATAEDKERFRVILAFYNNINAIRKNRKRSSHCNALMWLGYSFKEAMGEDGLYPRLMKEIDVKYNLVNPELIEELEKAKSK